MRVTGRKLMAGLAASVAIVSTALVFTPTASWADSDIGKSCTKSFQGTTYTGQNWMYYYDFNSYEFNLDWERYQFGPADSSSKKNNQNFYFWGGSQGDPENSGDDLWRDDQPHRSQNYLDWGTVTGQIGLSYIKWTDIFDVPNVSDPSCSATTSNF